jgi:hypothetical protein
VTDTYMLARSIEKCAEAITFFRGDVRRASDAYVESANTNIRKQKLAELKYLEDSGFPGAQDRVNKRDRVNKLWRELFADDAT